MRRQFGSLARKSALDHLAVEQCCVIDWAQSPLAHRDCVAALPDLVIRMWEKDLAEALPIGIRQFRRFRAAKRRKHFLAVRDLRNWLDL